MSDVCLLQALKGCPLNQKLKYAIYHEIYVVVNFWVTKVQKRSQIYTNGNFDASHIKTYIFNW